MSSLSSTPRRRLRISKAPRAKLTISMDAERDGAIPLSELAGIAGSVQQIINQIVRALNDRSGQGRPPDLLKKLSALEAVGIQSGSAVLEIEAPHDMEQFEIDFGEADAGVQAIELFVQSIDALGRGVDPPADIGEPAMKSLRSFANAVEGHERVWVESLVASTVRRGEFSPSVVPTPSSEPVYPPTTSSVELLGTLYEADVRRHQYRIEDERGHTQYLTMDDGLDDIAIARNLLGEVVRVTAVRDPGDPGSDHFIARVVTSAQPSVVGEYYTWNLEEALADVAPVESLRDLAIPGLGGEEFDAFWQAVTE